MSTPDQADDLANLRAAGAAAAAAAAPVSRDTADRVLAVDRARRRQRRRATA